MSLKENLEVLKTLDSKMLELTDEEGLAGEIEEADTYKGDKDVLAQKLLENLLQR